LALLFRLGDTAPQTEDAGLKLLLVNKAVRITVNEPCEPLAQLPEVGFHRRTRRVLGGRFWRQPTPIFFSETLGVGEQRRDLAPHRHIEQIGPHLGILTDPLPAKAIRLRPEAAVVGVCPRLPFAGTGAEAFPIVGIAPVLTLHQALEQIEGATLGLPRMAAILLQLRLDCGKYLGSTSAGTGMENQSAGGISTVETARRGWSGRPRWARSRGRSGS
jgi:hypothetical protein